MQPRKHAELIKAWADGAEIQRLGLGDERNCWEDEPNPTWADDEIYRRKSVPKEDYVKHGLIEFCDNESYYWYFSGDVTFDGETGEPKKVEIVK